MLVTVFLMTPYIRDNLVEKYLILFPERMHMMGIEFKYYYFFCVYSRDVLVFMTVIINGAYIFEIMKTVRIPFKP